MKKESQSKGKCFQKQMSSLLQGVTDIPFNGNSQGYKSTNNLSSQSYVYSDSQKCGKLKQNSNSSHIQSNPANYQQTSSPLYEKRPNSNCLNRDPIHSKIPPKNNISSEIRLAQNTQDSSYLGIQNQVIAMPHHGGSKSLDQQTLKRIGSIPSQPVHHPQHDAEQNSNTYQLHPKHTKNSCSTSSLIQSHHSNPSPYSLQFYAYNPTQSSNRNTSTTDCSSLASSTSNNAQPSNKLNPQHQLQSTVSLQEFHPNQQMQQINRIQQLESKQVQPQLNLDENEQKLVLDKQQQISSKQLQQISSKQLDQYQSSKPSSQTPQIYIPKLQQWQSQNPQIVSAKEPLQQQQNRQAKDSQKLNKQRHQADDSEEEVKALYLNENTKPIRNIEAHIQFIKNTNQPTKKLKNEGHKRGVSDLSLLINNSINYRDISIIKPTNVQDTSCFSRDQSMFFETNPRDLSLNFPTENSSTNANSKQSMHPHIVTTSSGQPGSSGVTNQFNFNNIKSSENCMNLKEQCIFDNITKEYSVNYSKVEEISMIMEQERVQFEQLNEQKTDKVAKLHFEIRNLQIENALLREQLLKSEQMHALKHQDFQNQLIKHQQASEEHKKQLQIKIDSLSESLICCKKNYEDKINRLQGLVQQQQQVNMQQNEDSDTLKLVECLKDMVVNFAPEKNVETKPTIKQIWKWLKNVLKEYMTLKSHESIALGDKELIAQVIKQLKVQKQSDVIPSITKFLDNNETYSRILSQIKTYFRLDRYHWQNLSEIECFFQMKNQQNNKILIPQSFNNKVSSDT